MFFCFSIHTQQEHFDTFMCDHKGQHTLYKYYVSDALMLLFFLFDNINTQQEDLIHSCETIKAGIKLGTGTRDWSQGPVRERDPEAKFVVCTHL